MIRDMLVGAGVGLVAARFAKPPAAAALAGAISLVIGNIAANAVVSALSRRS